MNGPATPTDSPILEACKSSIVVRKDAISVENADVSPLADSSKPLCDAAVPAVSCQDSITSSA